MTEDEVVPGASPAPPPSRAEALRLIGARLDDVGGSPVGKIHDVLVDADDGEPTWLVTRIGLLGGRAPVPFDLAAPAAGRVWVPFGTETIRSATAVAASGGLTCADESSLAGIYEVPERPRCSGASSDAVASVPAEAFESATSSE